MGYGARGGGQGDVEAGGKVRAGAGEDDAAGVGVCGEFVEDEGEAVEETFGRGGGEGVLVSCGVIVKWDRWRAVGMKLYSGLMALYFSGRLIWTCATKGAGNVVRRSGNW
jgi:hypothetical protein